jgi:hypothetical protein
MERGIAIERILSFLRGDNQNIDELINVSPEIVSRCIAYQMQQRDYHRQHLCQAIVRLINIAPTPYRGTAWQLIQEMQLSHLLEIFSVMNGKDNTRRLRFAIATKLAQASRSQLIRAFFMKPQAYRDLFEKLYLPRTVLNGKPITNDAYQLAHALSTLSIPKALAKFDIKISQLVKDFRLPLEKVMDLVSSPHDAIALALVSKGETFFRHGRWFRNIIGDTKYEELALQKVKTVKNPLGFTTIKQHLEETGAITPLIAEHMEKRAEEAMEAMLKQFDLDRIALIVDVSGSMRVAVEITTMLYEAFSKLKGQGIVVDLIAFNDFAYTIEPDRLQNLPTGGMTSIGSAFVMLEQRWRGRQSKNLPQAIILVSDLEENTEPPLSLALERIKQYNAPPLVVLLCGSGRGSIQSDYPHAILPTQAFHKGLIMGIMKQIARLTQKVSKTEGDITKAVKKRRPIEEEIGLIDLPTRPQKTYTQGYLEQLLCSN